MKYKNNEYRVRKMNAVELLAMRSQINFKDFQSACNFYNLILENMEVCINEKWIPVKQKSFNSYTPTDIIDDVKGVEKLAKCFYEYFESVFPKSDE